MVYRSADAGGLLCDGRFQAAALPDKLRMSLLWTIKNPLLNYLFFRKYPTPILFIQDLSSRYIYSVGLYSQFGVFKRVSVPLKSPSQMHFCKQMIMVNCSYLTAVSKIEHLWQLCTGNVNALRSERQSTGLLKKSKREETSSSLLRVQLALAHMYTDIKLKGIVLFTYLNVICLFSTWCQFTSTKIMWGLVSVLSPLGLKPVLSFQPFIQTRMNGKACARRGIWH